MLVETAAEFVAVEVVDSLLEEEVVLPLAVVVVLENVGEVV